MNVPYTWFCDIEVEVTAEGFPEPEDAKTPINTISMSRFPQTIIWSRKNLTEDEKSWVQEQIEKYSEDPQICGNPDMKDISKGYKFEFRYFKTEREMLDDFLNFCIPITAIAGWNFLNFDWLYITNRCIKNGLDIDKLSPTRKNTTFKITPRSGGATINLKLPMHKMVYDYMLVFKTWDQTVESCENHSLDYIGHRVLGIGKKPHDWGFIDGYEKYFADYVFYNCIDTIILEQIDKQINTAKIWFMLTSILRIDSYDAFSTIRPTETVMCNFEYPHYRVFPNVKREIPKEQEKYQGAWVLPVQPNMYRMVGGLDFASLYPSIMRQFLISPESFIKQDINHVPKKDEIKTISGAVYKRDENSMIPAILTHYFGMRKQAKSDMKQADTERQYYLDILTKRLNKI
jgi:DNA polymerase elongation subunit (family B)